MTTVASVMRPQRKGKKCRLFGRVGSKMGGLRGVGKMKANIGTLKGLVLVAKRVAAATLFVMTVSGFQVVSTLQEGRRGKRCCQCS